MSFSMSIGTDFPSVVDPRLFRSINSLCKEAIAYSGNHVAIRDSVNVVLMQLKKISFDRFGHDNTIDVKELGALMKRTDPREPKPAKEGRRDPIESLLERRKILPEQYEAALHMRQIYDAFGRVFSVSARDYRKPRSGHIRMKSPVDLIPVDVLNIWHFRYTPWTIAIKKRSIINQNQQTINTISIVYAIVLDGLFPYETDDRFRLKRGEAFSVLTDELNRFCQYRVET